VTRLLAVFLLLILAPISSADPSGTKHEIPTENFLGIESGATGFRIELVVVTPARDAVEASSNPTLVTSSCISFVKNVWIKAATTYPTARHESPGGYLGYGYRCGFYLPVKVSNQIEFCVPDGYSGPSVRQTSSLVDSDWYGIAYRGDSVRFQVNLLPVEGQKRQWSIEYYCRLSEPWTSE
jgi:hypothetical protein